MNKKINIPKNILEQKYIKELKSAKQIADELNLSNYIIWSRLKEYKLIRNQSEAIKLACRNHKYFCQCCICKVKRGEYKGNDSRKGHTISEEAKDKMRKSMLGRKFTEDHKRKISQVLKKNNIRPPILRGKNHPNWKGGITPLRDLLRNSTEYKIWRNACWHRDNHICQECGSRYLLEVHHHKPFEKIVREFLNYYNQFSPIEDLETLVRLAIKWKPFWDIDNGITLCKKCHKKVRSKKWN